MPNTYTQIYIQFVFAVKYRQAIIQAEWKTDLYKYITGIIQNNGHKLIAINGVADHIHILVGYKPTQSFSELMRDVKANSSKWINEQKFLKSKFEWQEGYGAFSYSESHLKNVIRYIENQEKHHQKNSFKVEYQQFLNDYGIEYDERYIFKELA